MDREPVIQSEAVTWTKTREAIAQFRKLLLCSKCSNIMKEPVCLGLCEHMLCRSCAGPHAGDGCSVCHSPAWVKDIQINRQLCNITELFCNLDSLLNPTEVSATPTDAVLSKESSVTKKKNFKIWFSPKSRKVRCCVEKPVEVNLSKEDQQKKPTTSPASKPKDLSVFNFTSSSQDSGSSTPPRGKVTKKTKTKRVNPACKQARGPKKPVKRTQTKQECKRLKLEAINQQWGFGKEGALDRNDEEAEKVSSGDDNSKSSKRVSFQCPGSQPEEPQKTVHQGENQNLIPDVEDTESGGKKPPSHDQLSELVSDTSESNKNAPGSLQSSPSRVPKRARVNQDSEKSASTPKRPRTSPGRRKRLTREGTTQSTPLPTKDLSQSLRTSKQSKEEQNVKLNLSPLTRRSSYTPVLGRSPVVRRNQRSPAYMKRNHKGETPLHLAAIKGDVEEVRNLLVLGADPNLKDNAGWTPLHEACNLGHLAVVDELLQHGALLNTPGYQNDSPLHDAVRNGHLAVVRLLVKRGASQSVLNMFGLQPLDYALTSEMQKVLTLAPEVPHPVTTPLSPSGSLIKASGCVRETGPVVLIGSQLTQTQQKQLAKAAKLLGGKQVESFNSAVTHVVVPDDPTKASTLTALQGILNGCWILRFSWVSSSLQADSWAGEDEYEAGEGPLRARVNIGSLLPPLFDGCFFYLLGSFRKPPKHELLQLVREGGGHLLSRQPKPDSDVTQTLSAAAYHAHPGSDQALCTQYILYDPQSSYKPQRVRIGKVWSAPSTWLLDCISAFQLLPVPEP
ncbi:BRCA1-associated RING domain protein 1-like [Myxocyprinus asiaticus]|uniref:BRCA1-associated RING domain protein 1-like n=1 Tax=Myxocyprinus asiaticus TaxID=70543 RepID=UPI002222CBAC|nr:BRCA1-associated RING domain protein 1-like [Myxocyprinus asiaticus]